MGIFGRSRANTTNEISRPVLTFSDAAPRDDLHSLGKLDSTKSRPHAPTAEKPAGTTSNNGRHGVRRQPQKNVIQAFDFTVTQPPEAPLAVDEPTGLNDGGISSNGIGIALGSPSMVPPPPPPYPPTEWGGRSTSSEKQYTATTMVGGPGSLRRKPSKWKKFGGMLKGRQNDGKRGREGFYQLNLKNDQDDTSPFVQQSQFPVNAGDKQQPIASASPQFSDRWEDNQQIAPTDSLLAVNIPTVEMERYSVMFRSVLGEKPSSNLLARRSKALNQLHVIGQEPGLHEPPKPQRRATSPSTNGSSTLTLLPGNPQTKTVDNSDNDKTADSQGFAPRSPIRSNTFPRATKNHHHENNLMVPDLTPALSSATSSGYSYSSAEPSPIPFNMPITTARNCIDGKNEPVWEMITTKKSASVSPEGIITSSDTETSTKSSLTSGAMTTPLIAQDPVEVVQKGKPTTKPSITALPPRNASLPAYADRAKLKVKSTVKNNNNNNNNNRTQEDDDPSLSLANETNNNPPPPPPRLQLHRSQTMPLPLNITKKTSTTNLLHPSPIHASTDSLDTTTTPSSQTPSPQIPQTIEISIARSVSVSRRIIPRQTLVPLGPANPQIFFSNENERYGELRQKRVPVVIDVPAAAVADNNRGLKNGGGDSESMGRGGGGAGHKYQKSQDIVIESA